MDKDLLYQQYLSNNEDDMPYEEFAAITSILSEEDLKDFVGVKKKDQPTENGTPSLTTGIPPSQTDLNPTIPNPIPENEFMVPMGSEQDLSSPSLGITAEIPSTDLPSTATASSGLENSNVTLPTVTQPALSNVGNTVLSTIQKPTTPLDILAGKSNNIQGDIKPTPSSQAELDADTAKNNFEANQLKIDAQKSSNDFIDQYKNKDYIRTKVAEFNPDKPLWIDKNAVDLDSETYVNQILEREKRGEVTVARNNEGQIIDKDSQPITDNNNILWQPKGKYVDEYNATVRDFNTQVGEQNVDSARFNQGNIGNEPEQDGFREFASLASKFGVLPTTEEYANLTTTEQRNYYLATAEATQNAQKNGTTFQEEYDKVIPKYALTEQVKIANGFEALNILNGGLESGNTKNKSESDFFNNYFADKNNVMQFGEYWNNEGKAKYQSSQVMENQANYQAHRAKIWNDYLSYQNDKLGTDMRFIEEAVVNASALADKYVLSGDMASAQKEIDKVNSLSEQYSNNEAGMIAVSNLYSESNKNFTQLQKQKKQETDIQLKVENGDVLSNVGSILGQIPLGIATSVNSTISGVGRILSSAIPSDNLKDALDIMSATDLKVGNVKVASLSNKIVDFVGSDGYKYREINGKTYGINNDGKLFATKYNRGQNDKVEKESVDYNWGSGLAFVTSKMMTDIVLTTAVGGGINKGLASASSRIANSKNIATVFGEGSQLAKSAESFARLAKNADNVSVSGWYVQMYNDSYQMAERGGIKGELNKSLYAITQSFMQSVIQRINPDINFLKSMNDESRQIVRALMTNEKDKAVQLISAFVKKTGNNVLKETGEELVQQVTQDINNIVINKIGKTNLETTDGQGYKEVVFGTVIPSAVASLMGGKGSRIANINNKEIDLTTYSRNELVTELARDKNGVDLIKDFRNTAYFQSQKDFAQDIANEITERQKYISKVPEVEKYSTPALSEVAPILQQIDKKKEDLKKDDGTFAERINKDIAELTTQANAILDNDLTQNNESPNAETAQPTSQSETVQEQTTETEQSEVATEFEQPTITGEQNVPSELNPTQDGQTTAEIQSPTAETQENVQPSDQAGQDTANQLPEMGQGIAQSENVTQEVAQEEVKPIRQLGTGDNVYFESEKHRLNESQFRDKPYILNIGDRDSVFPRANIEFSDLNEAKFVAEKVDKDFPKGMPDAILVDKYIDQIKQEYQNQTTQSQEEINEDDIVLANDTIDLINSLEDETTPSDNTGNDGNTESTLNIVQQEGENNGAETTTEPATSQGAVEVNNQLPTITTPDGKSFYQKEDGNWYGTNAKGAESKVTRKNRITELDNLKKEESVILIKEKDGFTYKKYKDGSEEIISSKDKVINSKTTKIVRGKKKIVSNPQFTNQRAKIFGEMTDNQIKVENAKRRREALMNFVPSNVNEVAMLYFANGGKITSEEISKRVLGNSEKLEGRGVKKRPLTDYKWAFLGKDAKTLDDAQMAIREDYPYFNEQDITNALADVVQSYSSSTDIAEEITDRYNSSVDPYFGFTDADIVEMQQAELNNEQLNLLNSVQDNNDNLSDEQLLDYYKDQYENSIENLTKEQQDEIYKPTNSERNAQQSNQTTGNEVGNSKNKTSPEYKSLIEQRDSAEKEVAIKKAKLDSVSKNTNKNFQADQEDLFGERQTSQEDESISIRELAGMQEGEVSAAVFSQLNKGDVITIGRKRYEVTTKSTGKTKTTFKNNKGNDVFFTKDRTTLKEILPNGEYGKPITGELINYSNRSVGMFNGGNSWNNLSRDIEGDISIDLINEYNKFHEKSDSYNLAQKTVNEFNSNVKPTTQLFDERADGNAGKEVIATAKREYDQAKAELTRINNAIRDFESGSASGTGAIDFQSTDKTFTPIPQSTYNKLVNRLLGVFKKFGGKVITTKAEVDAKLKEFGVADYMIKAFHGSPHRFDRFSTEFMGSGEGAQAFGWGLYFTDVKSIADEYATKLSGVKGSINSDVYAGVYDFLQAKESNIKFNNGEFSLNNKRINKTVNSVLIELKENNPNVNFNNKQEVVKLLERYLPNRGATYNVSLHKGKTPEQYTWLEWDKPLNKKAQKLINESDILNTEETLTDTEKERVFERDNEWFINGVYGSKYKTQEQALSALRNVLNKPILTANQFYGEGLYKKLSSILGGDKQASLFLLENGIDGIKYPAESISRGATSDNARGFNYVVFDENAVTIDEVVEFMKTKDGEIYGAKFPDGTIYLNPEKVNANTPIHEFSHLWQQLMPTRFKKGVELLKNTPIGKKTFAELKANEGYANKSDEELWDEAMVTVMGNEGERIFNSPRASKLKEWLTDLFKALGNAFGIRDLSPNDKLSTFVKGALSEVMGTKEIIPESSVEQKEVPIYIKKMSNTDLRGMLDKLGLVMDAVCP